MSEKEIQKIKNEALQEVIDDLMKDANSYVGMGYHCEIAEVLQLYIVELE